MRQARTAERLNTEADREKDESRGCSGSSARKDKVVRAAIKLLA